MLTRTIYLLCVISTLEESINGLGEGDGDWNHVRHAYGERTGPSRRVVGRRAECRRLLQTVDALSALELRRQCRALPARPRATRTASGRTLEQPRGSIAGFWAVARV